MTIELSIDEMARLTAGQSMWTTAAIPEAGLPSLTMADGPMGVAGPRVDERDVSLLTPAPLSLGASWDRALVQRIGQLVGGEAVRRGVDLLLAPNLNLARSPLAGRAFEYFSEDPLLCGGMGAAWIQGCQSTGTGAVAKHLVCNDSETMRDRLNVVVDAQTLREIYLQPFEMAAAAGCAGMLTGYNKVNGAWCSEAGALILDIAKNEWNYPGVFMSDWFGTHSTVGAMGAGLDLEMPGPARFLGQHTAAAVAAGTVTRERLRDAAQRVAATANRFSVGKAAPLADAAASALLIEAAAAGFTLVRNEHAILPLDPHFRGHIAVIGPNASAPCLQGGTFAKIAVKPGTELPIDAVRARFQHAHVTYDPGVDPQRKLPRMTVCPGRALGDGCVTGMTLDYFDNSALQGQPVASETRDANSLTWFHGVHEAGALQRAAGTRASGRYLPDASGAHVFFVGGTGALRLTVDGVEVFRRDEQLAPGDVMGRLKSGDADQVSVALVGGKAVEVVVELRYTPARCQGLWYGVRGPGNAEDMMVDAVAAATRADVVLLVVGETSDASVESKDRSDTLLPAEQRILIERICGANPNTVIVTNVGHAFDTQWQDRARAVLHCWYPGQEFGPALAQVLSGEREPGGRMPVSIAQCDSDYPALSLAPADSGDLQYSEGARIGYRGMAARGAVPRNAFGSGFGYASIAICSAAAAASADGAWIVRATLRNTGHRGGAEVVQIYKACPHLALVGFAKVFLHPGEEHEVRIVVPRRAVQVWQGAWTMPPGPLDLLVGRSSVDLPFVVSINPHDDA